MFVESWNRITVSVTVDEIRILIIFRIFYCYCFFMLDHDVSFLTNDFEIQAWANDLVEQDPLLGCNIKVMESFLHRIMSY